MLMKHYQLYPDLHTYLMCSILGRDASASQVSQKSIWYFLCNSADKPTTKQTNGEQQNIHVGGNECTYTCHQTIVSSQHVSGYKGFEMFQCETFQKKAVEYKNFSCCFTFFFPFLLLSRFFAIRVSKGIETNQSEGRLTRSCFYIQTGSTQWGNMHSNLNCLSTASCRIHKSMRIARIDLIG